MLSWEAGAGGICVSLFSIKWTLLLTAINFAIKFVITNNTSFIKWLSGINGLKAQNSRIKTVH